MGVCARFGSLTWREPTIYFVTTRLLNTRRNSISVLPFRYIQFADSEFRSTLGAFHLGCVHAARSTPPMSHRMQFVIYVHLSTNDNVRFGLGKEVIKDARLCPIRAGNILNLFKSVAFSLAQINSE